MKKVWRQATGKASGCQGSFRISLATGRDLAFPQPTR